MLDPGVPVVTAAGMAAATVLAVSNIDSPTELNSRAGNTNGALCIVTQNIAGANAWTLYCFDATSSAGVNSPYILAASGSGQWIAVGGKYINGANTSASAITGASLASTGSTSVGATSGAARLTVKQSSDATTGGFRLIRSGTTDYHELFMVGGLGSLNDPLTFYSSFAGTAVAAVDRSGIGYFASRVLIATSTDDGVNRLQVSGSVKATTGITSIGATAGIGYGTGAGGTVTQATSKATGVTLNTVCGTITLNNASLAATTSVAFTLTNSAIAATDVIVIVHDSVGTLGAYSIVATPAAGSATITVRNNTAGALAEAIVLRFAVIKAVTA